MNNLTKIRNLANSFDKEFGDTDEGRGYRFIVEMIDRLDNKKPSTLKDLYEKITTLFKNEGIETPSYHSIEIRIVSISHISFQTYITGDRIEETKPEIFYNAVVASFNKNLDKLKKDYHEAQSKNDLAI